MTDTMTAQLEKFFADICKTDGHIPDCTGCKDHVEGMGCVNAGHPLNVAMDEA